MTEYCYVIQHKDGSCLYLSENGPMQQSMEFLKQLRAEGFQYAEERPLGDCMLRILTKNSYSGTTTGAVVRTNLYTGEKHVS